MSKYRLIKHDFVFNFANWPLESFPYIQFNRPVIFLGVQVPLAFEVKYATPLITQGFLGKVQLLPCRATCGTGGEDIRVIHSSFELIDLINSDAIDCSSIEVTGELSVFREDFLPFSGENWAPRMSMLFLEKI